MPSRVSFLKLKGALYMVQLRMEKGTLLPTIVRVAMPS